MQSFKVFFGINIMEVIVKGKESHSIQIIHTMEINFHSFNTRSKVKYENFEILNISIMYIHF